MPLKVTLVDVPMKEVKQDVTETKEFPLSETPSVLNVLLHDKDRL